MKKLGKLSIKPEKVIKNEELVNLRGGYSCHCYNQPAGDTKDVECSTLDLATCCPGFGYMNCY